MSEITVKAPGRICLFGDHQDYLELPIIACAINKYITISGTPNTQEYFEFNMPDLGVRFRENISPGPKNILENSSQKENTSHGMYLAAVIKILASYDCRPTKGYNITITGDIPINAGLSSSSAVVVAWVQWMLLTFNCNQEITPLLVAQIAYQAEVVEQHSPGGKMDQYTSALGDILYLETDLKSHYENLGNALTGLVIGVSGIAKDTLGVLGDLRGNALQAIAKIKKVHPSFELNKATLVEYDNYKSVLTSQELPFFYAAIQNHVITQEALRCFRKSKLDYKKIGALMTAHHKVLKESLQITVPRIDKMINAAINAGAYGAKIVGSGGGGSICALAPKGSEEKIIQAIKKAGGQAAYAVTVSKGVRAI